MRPDWSKPPILTLASAATGYIAWCGHPLALPAAIAFPLLWSVARNRRTASVVSATYFLAASRGLPQGVAAFYQSDIWPGLILWVVASSGFVFVHAVLWSRHTGLRKAVRYQVAMILMAVPPFGFVGWAHPITAAGILFPAWGWAGLAAIAAALSIMTTRYWPAAAIALAGCWLWSTAFWTQPETGPDWQGIDLQMGYRLGRDAGLGYHRELLAAIGRSNVQKRIVVLPESALGFWSPTVASLWQTRGAGAATTVIAGAAIIDETGYDNVLVQINGERSRIFYRQRMPVPGSMWQPWRRLTGEDGGVQAHVFANPVASVDTNLIAPLLCYELLIVWPVLQSMIYEPDLIVAAGNGWWTTGTNIVAIQLTSAQAWARLFGKPLVTSFNS